MDKPGRLFYPGGHNRFGRVTMTDTRREWKPGNPSPNKDYPDSVSTYRHAPCEYCGEAGHAHDRERVYPDDGPAGSWHYKYRCPGDI